MEEGGFKKKFLAPLVVIMLCAVALAGAAYAWSTSVHGDGDIPGSTYYTIDMYSDSEGKSQQSTNLITLDGKSFVAYTTKDVTGKYYGCTEAATLTFETYVKVRSNSSTATCVISGDAKYVKQKGTADMYADWADNTSDDKITTNVTVTNDGLSATQTIGNTYKVVITVTLPALKVNLDDDSPDRVPTLMNFNGTGCICINLTAGPVVGSS